MEDMISIKMKLWKYGDNSHKMKIEKRRDELRIFFSFRRRNFDLDRDGRSRIVNEGENEFNSV